MKLGKSDRELEPNFYRKGDGTGCYYFELDDLRDLFANSSRVVENGAGLEILELDYVQRVYRNRGGGTTRRRVWVQGRIRKPIGSGGRAPVVDGDNRIGCGSSEDTLERFLETAVERWDAHYRSSPLASKATSLPSNLLQMFPAEFGPWQPPKRRGEEQNKENSDIR